MVKKIVGVDEAGRWAWAGPVVAGACRVLRPRFYKSATYRSVCDSKLLSESTREDLFDALCEARARGDVAFATGFSHAPTIDVVGIKEANRLAIEEALRQIISHSSDVSVWIDGNDHYYFPELVGDILELREFIRGDARHKVIGCASIVAKVIRDRYMRELALEYPLYGLERHKGYGTQLHSTILKLHGVAPFHRMSFAPIRAFVIKDSPIPHREPLKKTC